MYSLIALGFVLVYKATDAINFAQGEFVMLAGMIVVTVLGFSGAPLIVGIIVVLAAMIGFSFGLETVVLRPLLGRPVVAVIMATIGIAAMLRGLGPITLGIETRALPLPIGDEPIMIGPASLPPIQVVGAVVAVVFFIAFTWFFKKTRMGVAMRAIADNQQVAQAMGINVERYFAIAWAMAGIVSALGGIVWGSMLGVDVQLALVGLKVFPVVILGGLDSIGGALVGGLISRHRREPGGGLPRSLCRRRHQGLRALRADDRGPHGQALRHLRPAPDRARVAMFHRESGVFKATYGADMALYPLPIAKWTVALLALIFVVIIPLTVHEYYLSILNLIFIAVVGALGPQHPGGLHRPDLDRPWRLHVGRRLYRGQPRGQLGLPFWLTLPAGGLMAALFGVLVGMPSLRIKGLYLAIATLAGQLIIEWTINRVPAISGGAQASIQVDGRACLASASTPRVHLYFFLLFFAVIAIVATLNLVRSRIGRAFVAVRDQDIAAEIIGINIYRYKLLSFAISSFYAGVCGVLYTYYFGIANYEQFQLIVSIDYLAMIIIGGLGSVLGSVFGAVFVTLLPIAIRIFMENVGSLFFTAAEMANVISGCGSACLAPSSSFLDRRARGAQSIVEQYPELFPGLALLLLERGMAAKGGTHDEVR
jgi:ABC-type branched-subunit amino acid transport system permease subunit